MRKPLARTLRLSPGGIVWHRGIDSEPMHTKDTLLWPEGKDPAQTFCDEDARLSVLAAHGADALVDDPELQEIVDFAARLCDAPAAMVTLVERDRQHFVARTGIDSRETPRPVSFCAHAMLGSEPLVVEDTHRDDRFADNVLVTGDPKIRFYAGHPLISSEGAPLGSLCVLDREPRPGGLSEVQLQGLKVLAQSVMRRLAQRRLGSSATEAVARGETELKRMIDSVPGIAWTSEGDGRFDYVNARWKEATGREPPTVTEEWREAIHPDDREAAAAKFRDALSRNVLFEDEWRLKMADGSYRWVQSRAVPVIADGGAARWFGTVIDVDRAHRLSESRDLLARELSHRIKNIFAVIGGLIAIRARGRDDVADFAKEIGDAIRSLGVAHDYVRPFEGRRGETLSGLLEDLLAPYGDTRSDRVQIQGAGVPIGQSAATPLALIFHELATNSAKYGALSCAEGRVAITVQAPKDGDDMVEVLWEEHSAECEFEGDATREGFGSRLLRLAVEGQLDGSFERNFSDDGLDVTLRLPLGKLGG